MVNEIIEPVLNLHNFLVQRIETSTIIGWPDSVYLHNGVTYYVENKIAVSNKPRDGLVKPRHQEKYVRKQIPILNLLSNHGAIACVALYWKEKVWYVPAIPSWEATKIPGYDYFFRNSMNLPNF